MLPARCARLLAPHLLLVLVQLSPACGHRTGPRFLISDRDPQCNLHCSRTQPKPICASDGRSYESTCEYQRAKCRDPNLGVVHRGRCKDAGQSKCRLERAQALEQAKKPQEAVFVPECGEDGSFTQEDVLKTPQDDLQTTSRLRTLGRFTQGSFGKEK